MRCIAPFIVFRVLGDVGVTYLSPMIIDKTIAVALSHQLTIKLEIVGQLSESEVNQQTLEGRTCTMEQQEK